jgi:hypothetical protein
MISFVALMWIFICIFALIGYFRGWAKELLVTFSLTLALFVTTIIDLNFPDVSKALTAGEPTPYFWLRVSIVLVLTFFGYQTPRIPKIAGENRFARDFLRDSLLGLIMGGVNGYLLFSSIWFFLDKANYPFTPYVTVPDAAVKQLLASLPPFIWGPTAIYVSIAVALGLLIVVFL